MVALRCGILGHRIRFCHQVTVPVGVTFGEDCPVLAGTLTLQDIDVEVGKGTPVHIEVRRTVGVLVQQVGTCPVQHGHEVVAHTADALFAEVSERLFVDLNLLVTVRPAIFDSLSDGQAFYHAPRHTIAFDILLEFTNLLASPDLAEGNIVQRSHNALHSDLSQLCKRNLVLLAKPSPCSFHKCILFYPIIFPSSS